MELQIIKTQHPKQKPAAGEPLGFGKYFTDHMFTMRYNAAGDCRYYLDDYFQYSPAAVMLGLKACGYESRSKSG